MFLFVFTILEQKWGNDKNWNQKQNQNLILITTIHYQLPRSAIMIYGPLAQSTIHQHDPPCGQRCVPLICKCKAWSNKKGFKLIVKRRECVHSNDSTGEEPNSWSSGSYSRGDFRDEGSYKLLLECCRQSPSKNWMSCLQELYNSVKKMSVHPNHALTMLYGLSSGSCQLLDLRCHFQLV